MTNYNQMSYYNKATQCLKQVKSINTETKFCE